MQSPSIDQSEGSRETARLEAFSDGIFAIAITLLILEVRVPELHDTEDGRRLGRALLDLWPAYLAYVTSFVTILIMWVNHHTIFKVIGRVSHTLFLLNGVLLLCITFVPFPTALMSEYLGHRGERLAAAFYSGSFTLTAIVFNALWRHVSGERRLVHPSVDDALVRRITRGYRFGPVFYLIAFLLAFLSAGLSLVVCLGLALFFALPLRLPNETPSG
jgi:uncharacterized membrane protein